MCEICSKLTIKTPERRQATLMLYICTQFVHCSSVFIIDFEQVNTNWDECCAEPVKMLAVTKPQRHQITWLQFNFWQL